MHVFHAIPAVISLIFVQVRAPIGNTLGEEGGGIFVMLRYDSPSYFERGAQFLLAISIMSDG